MSNLSLLLIINNMKKIFLGLLSLLVFLSVNQGVIAREGLRQEIRETVRETLEEGKEASVSPREIRKEVRKEVKEAVKEKNEGFMERVRNLVKKNLRFEARIGGKITAIETSAITVNNEDGDFKVNVTEKTKLVRRFGGKSELSEFSVGDEVNVIGKYTDDSKSTIDAILIRNKSVQKRWGAFIGEVTALNTDNFVMKTVNRGEQTVYFAGAEFVNREEKAIVYSDIKVGERVRVKGMWDRELNKLTEVDQVKNFSNPVKPTQSPKPTEAE
ncbi:MAG: hypothetical protein UR68_C0028G0034 [Candidatus Roizmanbacteria bacterium GW2011_GWA2_35_19]|uniref:DUF5666 domain-containing protein n=2 Tax=Candidatus Roizmaniibacteriota TaxID=1752723 RepID=A0A0G0EXA0_9BACT|nr:MAG: hypothetical protein UR63_C0010G0031 [Candidatus Roizmanbacteria bacterium GW2011_GWC2_35_12]KKP71717.1 MAG: hypothetical protein UR68_C0028G0034 [Candidatus Roizmanbacteria bacterium GW2011_GWA2_35_19]